MKSTDLSWLLLLLAISACGSGRREKREGTTMPTLTSPAFEDGERIPAKYTADGADVSPPLTFSNLPPGTKELALVCEDPDAPGSTPFVHWVAYGISPDTTGMAKGCSAEKVGGRSGRSSWGGAKGLGWGGPMPPKGSGDHHYVFTLYALDTKLDLAPGATREKLVAAMKGHVLGTGVLTGLYSR